MRQVSFWCQWPLYIVLRPYLRTVSHDRIQHFYSFLFLCFWLHFFFREKFSSHRFLFCDRPAWSSASHNWGVWAFWFSRIGPCIIFTAAALRRHFFIQEHQFAFQVLMVSKQSHQIDPVNRVSWNIRSCQIETAVNVNKTFMEPSSTPESLQAVKSNPVAGFCIKNFQR